MFCLRGRAKAKRRRVEALSQPERACVYPGMNSMNSIVVDGEEVPLFPGVIGIFGHGNVTSLGHSLEMHRDEIPVWRGQNEQSMALAAIGFAKAKRRRQLMVATSSIGPGALNMVTAAGVAAYVRADNAASTSRSRSHCSSWICRVSCARSPATTADGTGWPSASTCATGPPT